MPFLSTSSKGSWTRPEPRILKAVQVRLGPPASATRSHAPARGDLESVSSTGALMRILTRWVLRCERTHSPVCPESFSPNSCYGSHRDRAERRLTPRHLRPATSSYLTTGPTTDSAGVESCLPPFEAGEVALGVSAVSHSSFTTAPRQRHTGKDADPVPRLKHRPGESPGLDEGPLAVGALVQQVLPRGKHKRAGRPRRTGLRRRPERALGVSTVELGLDPRSNVDPDDRHFVEVAVDLYPLQPGAPDHGVLEVDVVEARLGEVDLPRSDCGSSPRAGSPSHASPGRPPTAGRRDGGWCEHAAKQPDLSGPAADSAERSWQLGRQPSTSAARSGPVAGSRYGAPSSPGKGGPYWRRDEAVPVMALAGASARRSGCLRANAGSTSTGWRPRRQWRWRVRRCPRTATAEAIPAFNSDRAYRARRHLNPNALVGRSVRGHPGFRRRAEHELPVDGLQTRW